jgi:cell shape-determining protein MreD
MKYLVFVILVFLAAALQFGLLPPLAIYGGIINLIILILVSSFFLEIEKEGLFFSLILALLFDLYLYSFFGVSLISILLVYSLLYLIRKKIAGETNYLLIAILGFAASIIFDLAIIGVMSLSGETSMLALFLYVALPNALLTLVFAVPVYLIIRFIVKILRLYRLIKNKETRIRLGY